MAKGLKDVRRNTKVALRKRLLKKAIKTSRGVRRAPPPSGKKGFGIGKIASSKGSTPAVRKTKTATEAASGAQRGWRKLYAGDLDHHVTEGDIRKEFGKFGAINSIWIARSPPGFAFVDFIESRDAARALRNLDGSNKLGAKIKVEFAKKLGPRTASAIAAAKDKMRRDIQKAAFRNRSGRPRRFSGSRGGSRRSAYSPPRSWSPPQTWQSRLPPGRMSPPRRRRFSPRRSPSPGRRGNYPPAPSIPPLPFADPYDPRFREMALMGGWSRGRSPLMAPPPPPPPRYRSRSPSPRYRGRSPPNRRSPGRHGRDRNRGRGRDFSDRFAAASLVYPPLSLPPPSMMDMGNSPPRRGRSPPRRRTPPPLPMHPVRFPPRGVGRGRSPPPPPTLRTRSPPRFRQRSPPRHRMKSPIPSRPRTPPPRGYSPQPPDRMRKISQRGREHSPPHSYGGPPPPPPRSPPRNNSWSPPGRRHSPLPPMRVQRSPPMRSRSRSPMRMASPPRPRSPPPEPNSRSWSPPLHSRPPKSYSPVGRGRSPERMHSRQIIRRDSPTWDRSPPPRSPLPRERSPMPRGRTPPRPYMSPPRGRSPPRHKNMAPYSGPSSRSRSPVPQRRQMSYQSSGRR